MPAPVTNWTGVWWLPSAPGRRVPGTLTFGSRYHLVLRSQLELPATSPAPGTTINLLDALESRTYPVLFGDVDGVGAVTLVEAVGSHFVVPLGEVTNQSLDVRYALQGLHLGAEQLIFDRFVMTTDRLWDWASPLPPEALLDSDGFVAQYPAQDLLTIDIGNGVLHLAAYPTIQRNGPRLDGQLVITWDVELKEAIGAPEGIDKWMGPLRDLVSMLTRALDRITSITVRSALNPSVPIDLHMWLLGDDLPQRAEAVLPDEQVMPLASIRNPAAVVASWISTHDEQRIIRARLLVGHYQSMTFEDVRVLHLSQAAEGLHRLLWDRPSVEPAIHDARVNACVASAPPEYRKWAKSVLSNANQLSLRIRVLEIVERAVAFGMPLQPPDIAAFARVIASTRNLPSHGASLAQGGELEGLFWAFQALDWILRVVLLGVSGVERGAVSSQLLQQRDFRHLAQQLNWVPAGG